MAITRTAMIDDDGSGTTGTIINNAWKQELYNQIDAANPGAWINVPYSAANFTATGGTWTVTAGQQATFAYRPEGSLVTVQFYLSGGTIGGTPSNLIIQLPAMAGWRHNTLQPVVLFQSTGQMGVADCRPGETRIFIYRDIGQTPFAAGALYLSGSIVAPQ